jgi:hypothetical protein
LGSLFAVASLVFRGLGCAVSSVQPFCGRRARAQVVVGTAKRFGQSKLASPSPASME